MTICEENYLVCPSNKTEQGLFVSVVSVCLYVAFVGMPICEKTFFLCPSNKTEQCSNEEYNVLWHWSTLRNIVIHRKEKHREKRAEKLQSCGQFLKQSCEIFSQIARRISQAKL